MTKIVAHRGASQAAPENTLAAVNLAWSWGVDAVEVDVHLSGDGQLAVIHDDNTFRTTSVQMKVGEATMTQLQSLNAGWHKGAKFKGEPIPTLPQVLATVPPGKQILVEVKEKNIERVVPVLQENLLASGLEGRQVVVMSFDYELVRVVREAILGISVLWIYGDYKVIEAGGWPAFRSFAIAHTKAAGLSGINLGQHHERIDGAFVKQIQAAGLTANFWTVDSPAKARLLLEAGADSITTNLPDWVMALRAGL